MPVYRYLGGVLLEISLDTGPPAPTSSALSTQDGQALTAEDGTPLTTE